jgi:hypothetical protein
MVIVNVRIRRRCDLRLPLLAAILCAAIASVLLGCRGDRRESFYPSLADADKEGAITRGWIPDFLPGSSRSIHEIHEMSPSTEWCAFEFSTSDPQSLQKNLRSVDALPQAVQHVPSANVSWWPGMLTGVVDVQQLHKAGFTLYTVVKPETSVTTEVMLFAVDWGTGRGFFYRTRE